jgi:glycolate oxidase iron-sulfur subunit
MAARWWCPNGQGCCGALHLHAGEREEARKLARNNIDAILAGSFDANYYECGGCGSTLKEYGELLEICRSMPPRRSSSPA